jgi:RecA-family ATPase
MPAQGCVPGVGSRASAHRPGGGGMTTSDALHDVLESAQFEEERRYRELRARLVDADGLRKLPPPPPLIEGWLFENTLAWIQGKWGNAKSFLAVDIGCCVATGTSWHGHAVTQGPSAVSDRRGCERHFPACRCLGGCQRSRGHENHLPACPGTAGQARGVDVAAFRMLLDEIRPKLTIIDTQARVTVGAEENSSKDMGLFVDALEILRLASGSTMLPVHHEPRNGDNLRGSIALEGAAESILQQGR